MLSESYLYTSDAIKDSVEHLAPGGLLVNQFGDSTIESAPTRTARYVQSVRTALEEMGIKDPERHIVVATNPSSILPPLSTILTKREPFTEAEISAFGKGVAKIPNAKIVYAPGHVTPTAGITRFIVPDAPGVSHAHYRYSVDSISDNKPFFWHYTPFAETIKQLRPAGLRLHDRGLRR